MSCSFNKITVLLCALLIWLLFPSPVHAIAQTETSSVVVNALVPPNNNDYQFSFTTAHGHVVHQNEVITYNITYGASQSAGLDTNTTIVVRYSDTKSPKNAFILDYVVGSATDGFGDAQPVIDPLARTITWTIINLPAGTMDQHVQFKLKTTNSYTEQKIINFVNRATMTSTYFSFPEQATSQDYLYKPEKSTPQPTSIPQATPTPTTQITLAPLKIVALTLDDLTLTNARITLLTNNPTRAQLYFGNSMQTMTNQPIDIQFIKSHTFELTQLTPNTQYYFKVFATDAYGQTVASDIYTFTTPKLLQLTPLQGADTLTITSGKLLLLSKSMQSINESVPTIVLPTGTGYQIAYTFEQQPQIVYMDALIVSEKGIDVHVRLSPLNTTSFTASLETGSPGLYQIILMQKDENGNILSKKVSYLRVTNPLSVKEEYTSIPLGDARVYLSYYDIYNNTYIPLGTPIYDTNHNPIYTDKNGEYKLTLPPGQYKAEASAFGHKTNAVSFSIGQQNEDGYPTIILGKAFFNGLFIVYFIKDSFATFANWLNSLYSSLADSLRFYNIIAFIVLTSLLLTAILLFRLRTRFSSKHLVPFIVFHLYVLGNRHKQAYIRGIVINKEKVPLAQTRIEVLPYNKPDVLTHTITDKKGRFQIRNTFRDEFIRLFVSKENFPLVEMIIPTNAHDQIIITLQGNGVKTQYNILKEIAGSFFEIILILCFLAEILFIESFGLLLTIPFAVISLVNLILWLFFERKID